MKQGIRTAGIGFLLTASVAAATLIPAAARADDRGRPGCPPARVADRYDARADRYDARVLRDDARADRYDARADEDRARADRYDARAFRDDARIERRDRFVVNNDHRQALQNNKNDARNLATVGVAAAAYGVLTHNSTLTAIGAIGAVVGGTQYENDRKAQNAPRW